MDDSPTFPQIREMLGSCPPWFVRDYCYVAKVLEVSLEHDADAQFRCGMCDHTLPCHGDGPVWVYRCVTCDCKGMPVYVRFHMPQVVCPTHGTMHADVVWMRDPERWRFERIEYVEDDPFYGTVH
jgi:hypothetical protein